MRLLILKPGKFNSNGWEFNVKKFCCHQIFGFISLIVVLISVGWARSDDRDSGKFEHIGVEQGLFQRNITTILQDSRGFMWFGTTDGLNCYDGYEFTTFRFDPLDSTSISGNNIYSIYEDQQGFLWIITSGGGINRFNPGNRSFTHFYHTPDNPNSLSNDNVSCILEDHMGNFWLGTNGGGLNLLNRNTDHFYNIHHDPANPHSLSSNFINVMLEDQNGSIWLGTNGGGLNKLVLPKVTAALQSDSIQAILQFTRFYAQGPTYLPTIYDSLQSLIQQQRYISAIQQAVTEQDHLDFFNIDQATDVLVVCMGNSNAFGMTDYGWIEDGASDIPVWEMKYDHSTYFGGKSLNQIQIDVINLEKGAYKLRYRASDGKKKPVNNIEQNLWGIQLLSISPAEAKFFKKNLSKRVTHNWLPHNWVTDLHEDDDGNLWIGTADGLACLNKTDAEKETFSVYQHHPKNLHSLDQNYVSRIYETRDKTAHSLWITTASGKLHRLDVTNGEITRLSESHKTNQKNFFLRAGNKVSALLNDQQNALWVGTNSDGLYRLIFNAADEKSSEEKMLKIDNTVRFQLEHFLHKPNDPKSLSNNDITSIYEDRTGILWVGTARGGLNKRNRRQQKFSHIQPMPDDPGSLSHPVVTAILEDNSKNLWVGTYGGGINRLRGDTSSSLRRSFEHFRHQPGDPFSIASDYVTAIYQDQSGNLWVGTHGGGLVRHEETSDGKHQFISYKHNPLNANSISGNNVNTIYEGQYGQLWIGTNSGLNKFDRLTERFTHYRFSAANPYSLSNNEVWAIYEDSYSQGKTLWIGTRNGINKFDRSNNRFIRYTRDFDDPTSLNNPAVLSIFQDKTGNLWFGTYSGGLNKFDRDTEHFEFFTERDGLANNMIFGILEDKKSNLWLSTNKGISKFNPQTLTVQNFDTYDGLQANEFNAGAYFQNQQGEMFFGGVNGMNAFFPDSIFKNPNIPPVALTGFNILGKPNPKLLSEAQVNLKPIELSYRQNFISFEFAALDFTNPGKNRYAYKLDGVNKDWIDIGNRRFISFTNLGAGHYTFHVKGANNDGVWNETGTAVELIIHPPFWRTWWFLALFSIIAITLSVLMINFQIRQKFKRLVELEQTRLQENERVRTKAAHDFHDELGHKLTKISLFTELIKRNMKSISSTGTADDDVSDYLNRISETAKSLSGGMRDFIWTLDPDKDSLYEVAVRLKDFGDELFDKTGIHFRIEGLTSNLKNRRLNTDWRRHLTLIFKEAMNNALKHAHCKNVVLTIELLDERLIMSLIDDGRGMLSRIPAKNTRGNGEYESQKTGSPGNGLKNMQLRAEKLAGNVHFLPNAPTGTLVQFSAEIPRIGN